MATFTHDFQTGSFTGKTSFPTGLFIDGEFREGSEKTTIECAPLPLALMYVMLI
jgi:aldehyde dehydrogenase (NAD+)